MFPPRAIQPGAKRPTKSLQPAVLRAVQQENWVKVVTIHAWRNIVPVVDPCMKQQQQYGVESFCKSVTKAASDFFKAF